MARLRRRWRVAKWIGLISAILAVMGWIVSNRYEIAFYTHACGRDIRVHLDSQKLFVFIYDNPQKSNTYLSIRRLRVRSDIAVLLPQLSFGNRLQFATPIGILFLFFLIPTVFLFWLDRRRIPPHCCQSCGYDLTGNLSGVCPECGEKHGE